MLSASPRAWRGALGTIALLLALLVFAALAAPAASPVAPHVSAQEATQPVVLYFFWGNGCPHCATAKPFLEELKQRYPTLTVREYEVWYIEQNQQLFQQMAAAHGFTPSAVPTILVGDQHFVGFGDDLAREITAAVEACAASGCDDAGLGVIAGIPTPTTVPTISVEPTAALAAPLSPDAAVAAPVAPTAQTAAAPSELLTLPLFGTIDLSARSLVLSTALIAFVDGFNPCSLWVLSVLLALTLHTGSRRKVLLVGIVFITVTAFIYMLFITGLFTMFSVIRFAGWIQAVVGLVALAIGAINIKDYFWYKQGVSLTIADKEKAGIYRRMRAVVDSSDSPWALIGATIVLAAGVSLVEFSCTAGFPVLWTNLLTAHEATAATFVLLLLLYMLIYQLDELAIFLVAVFTLKSSRLEEKQGRILKLVSGMLMATLGVVMLVDPTLMSDLGTSLWVFAIAFGSAALVLLVHRLLLPKLGVYIGTELQPVKVTKRTRQRRK